MESLQEEVREIKSRQSGKYTHWPESIKEKCRKFHRAGYSIRELQENTGVSNNTIRLWVGKTPSKGIFKAVSVTPRARGHDFILRTPLGFEIEGLDLSQIKEFLEKKLL